MWKHIYFYRREAEESKKTHKSYLNADKCNVSKCKPGCSRDLTHKHEYVKGIPQTWAQKELLAGGKVREGGG